MRWSWPFRRRPLLYGPPEPRICPDGRCELTATHPPPHYHLTSIESGWSGWRRCGWSTWTWSETPTPGDYPLGGWLPKGGWPGTMTARMEERNR